MIRNPNKKWFTLIELLIATSISALLMASMIIFLWDAIRSAMRNEKSLSQTSKSNQHWTQMFDAISNLSWNEIIFSWSSVWTYWTWIVFATKKPNLPFTFVWIKYETSYCDSFSWSASATWNVNKLSIIKIPSVSDKIDTTNYKIDFYKNSIIKKSDWSIVIWVGGPSQEFNSASWALTWLSNPSSFIETANWIYVSDTGNDRILAMSLSDGKIYELANYTDWIDTPVDMFLSWWVLEVACLWNKKIISIEDSYWTSSLDLKFKLPIDLNWIDNIKTYFYWIQNIDSPYESWSFTFSWYSKNSWDEVLTWSTLIYSGTAQNFSSWTEYRIAISWISPLPTTQWEYPVRLDLLSWTNTMYFEKFPFLTIWDSKLMTPDWNVIRSRDLPDDFYAFDSTWNKKTITWQDMLSRWNEYVSEVPIYDLNFWIKNNVLNIFAKYYKYYDCTDEKHIIKEKIYKKNLD